MNYATLESLAQVAGVIDKAGASLSKVPSWQMLACVCLGPLELPIMAWNAIRFVYDRIEDNKRLSEAKLELYKEAVKRQNAIIKVLKNEAKLDADRIAELKEVNDELKRAIRELKEDLDSAA